MTTSQQAIFEFTQAQQLALLLETLSAKLGVALTLLSVDDGKVICSSGSESSDRFRIHCWPHIVAAVTLLHSGSNRILELDGHHLYCSRLDLAGAELALLTGSFVGSSGQLRNCPCPADAVSGIWPSAQELSSLETDLRTAESLIWQFLQGQWSQARERALAPLMEKMANHGEFPTADECYRYVVELAATAPGVAVAGLRVPTAAGTGRLVAWSGEGPANMPEELPIAGIWGKCLRDGRSRFVASLAEDPGVPLQLVGRVGSLSVAHIPLEAGGEVAAVLVAGFRDSRSAHSRQTRDALELVRKCGSLSIAVTKAKEDTVTIRRQLSARSHILEQLAMGSNPTDLLPEIEQVAGLLYGFSWVRVRVGGVKGEPDSGDIVDLPLRSGEAIIAHLNLRQAEVESLGTEQASSCVNFLERYIAVWLRLAERGQPGRNVSLAAILTPRELQVARLLSRGESNKTIASALGLSEKTIKSHVSNILRKLQLPDRTAVAVLVAKHGK